MSAPVRDRCEGSMSMVLDVAGPALLVTTAALAVVIGWRAALAARWAVRTHRHVLVLVALERDADLRRVLQASLALSSFGGRWVRAFRFVSPVQMYTDGVVRAWLRAKMERAR